MNDLAKKDLKKAETITILGIVINIAALPLIVLGASYDDYLDGLTMLAGGALLATGMTAILSGTYRYVHATKILTATEYIMKNNDLSQRSVEAILGQEVYVGMPLEDLLASVGKPIRSTLNESASGTLMQYVYQFGYVYLSGNKVSSISYTRVLM